MAPFNHTGADPEQEALVAMVYQGGFALMAD
jgi:hypothetical protein